MKRDPVAGVFVAAAFLLAANFRAETAVPEDRVLLTPPAAHAPRINGPKVYGLRPGSPLILRIPATGDRPMTFSAQGLPDGMSLDPQTGILTGRASQAGTYRITLSAANALGRVERALRLVVGDRLALTPSMGWNSWYIHYHRVSDALVRVAADQMIATGMADYGYQYVNIDGCWQTKPAAKDLDLAGPARDPSARIRPNRRFPDMKALTAYIHAKGLKAGIYTSPGPTDCDGYTGSYGHEALDARTFADWGFDFLKYDWCSYKMEGGGSTLEKMQRPYRKMWAELGKLDRDLVFNLCQYGMGDVWKWGGEAGNSWRTTGDLGMTGGERGLPGFYQVALSNAQHWQYARPGAWNDPDYLLIGRVGDAHHEGEGVPTTLTPQEQYAYMSLWCLMAAPLIYGGDMAKLDAFTLNVLCNPELIDVDQDPLGKQARVVRQTRGELVLSKPMEDGSTAVGLFNLGSAPARLRVAWSELGLEGPQQLRDLWRQRDLGVGGEAYEALIPRHGALVVRLGKSP